MVLEEELGFATGMVLATALALVAGDTHRREVVVVAVDSPSTCTVVRYPGMVYTEAVLAARTVLALAKACHMAAGLGGEAVLALQVALGAGRVLVQGMVSMAPLLQLVRDISLL